MDTLVKIVRTLASLPIIGGALVFVLGFFPLLAVIPFNLSTGLSIIIGGLLVAAWCYFLSAKKIINIVTPFIPIPLWVVGLLMAMVGVYGVITNAWDETEATSDVVMPETKPAIKEIAPITQPETTSDVVNEADQEALREQVKQLEQEQLIGKEKKQEFEKALEKARQEAKAQAPKVIAQMEESLENIKKLKGTEAEKQYEAIMKTQDPENAMTLDEAIAEMEKAIEDFKNSAYGAEQTK